MAPRDREQVPDCIVPEDGWPGLDAAPHRLRVDCGAVRDVGAALVGRAATYRQGPGSPQRLAGTLPAGAGTSSRRTGCC